LSGFFCGRNRVIKIVFSGRTFLTGLIWISLFGVSNASMNDPAEGVLINAVGDIMLGASALKTFEDRGYDYAFDNTALLLREGDINFGNLETPITDDGTAYPNKQFTFRMNSKAVESLSRVGFNLFSLANNHIMDFGIRGLTDTLAVLHRHGIGFSGAGENVFKARAPAMVTIRGKKIGLLAYSVTLPTAFYAGIERPGTAFAYREYLRVDIPRVKKQCDFLIVSFHWGKELAPFPEDYQIDLAHEVINLGGDLVLGHHPHVLQGIEIYQGHLIFYSLGNFAFSSYSDKVRHGMMARMTLSRGRISQVEIVPLNVYNREVDVQPRILAGEEAEVVIDELTDDSWPFGTVIGFEADRGWIDFLQ
jgi:poly-gamma-glutamate capsule biosynthesis protein CapA/YwtB (metallophosphatase superfamily)